jgi:hypothetical protein
MFARSDIYFRLHLLLIIIHITCISLSLRRTSAPIHLTSVLGMLGTQETSYIVIAGLLERDTFDLLLPEFDKPWVIHLRETCCCSTNLCTWRPNTVYRDRSVRRHHTSSLAPLQTSEMRRSNSRSLTGPHSTTPSLDDQGLPDSWQSLITPISSCGCPHTEDHWRLVVALLAPKTATKISTLCPRHSGFMKSFTTPERAPTWT